MDLTPYKELNLAPQTSLTAGIKLKIPADQFHHCLRVLRLPEGSILTVINTSSSNQPELYRCIFRVDGYAQIVEPLNVDSNLSKVDTVAVANSKGDTLEYVIEKSVELGVNRILVWQSKRSVPIFNSPKDLENRLKRWKKIADSAAKQSFSTELPKVEYSNSAIDATYKLQNPNAHILLCSTKPGAQPVRNVAHTLNLEALSIVVGPEGDLSDEEYLLFEGLKNCTSISLGDRILKVDTAAISAIVSASLWM